MVQHPVVHSDDGFDIIGDVHGHLEKLEPLLARMGYHCTNGVWRHPTRQAIFIGDLVDRGDYQVAVVRLVQAMVAAGSAHIVMGNHEYNAMAWHTPVADGATTYCRKHTHANRHQHKDFLAQVVENSALHHEFIEWFGTIPLWLEAEVRGQRLRCVHACWHDESMRTLDTVLRPDATLDIAGIRATSIEDSTAYHALETLLKGPEIDLDGYQYTDNNGTPRNRARIQWWKPTANTLNAAALIPSDAHLIDLTTGAAVQQLPDTPIEHSITYPDQQPVIVGHYWYKGTPTRITPYVACVDYSAAKEGPLVAYRWSGESELSDQHFVKHTD